MKISRDRKTNKIWLSQERYIEKVLEMFNIEKVKVVGFPFASHFKLSSEKSSSSKKKRKEM